LGKNAVYLPKRPIYGKTTAFNFKLQDPRIYPDINVQMSISMGETGDKP
jgi:hypothetical protein